MSSVVKHAAKQLNWGSWFRHFLHSWSNHHHYVLFYIYFFDVISVNAGLVSTWRMMGRLVWMLTNAPLPFLVASAALTLMVPTSACVWMATKRWSATLTPAKLCQVSLIFDLSARRFSMHNSESYESSDPPCFSFQLKNLFSLWRTTMRSGSWVWMAQIIPS